MKSHTVAEGDCLSSIAFENGYLWQTIWEHSSNQALRKLRQDPNTLYPGDVVNIPDPEEKEEAVALDQRHTFRLKGVPARLDLQFLLEGVPRVKVPFKLDVQGKVTEGETDEEGRVSIPIPPNARKGSITLGKGIEARSYDLDLGGLDPVTEISGMQARLNNLGYWCDVSGNWDDESREAMTQFQTEMGLPATGEADADTLDRLDAMHSGE
jgi:hypothetical protein